MRDLRKLQSDAEQKLTKRSRNPTAARHRDKCGV